MFKAAWRQLPILFDEEKISSGEGIATITTKEGGDERE
jgi:hypothetical protein